MTRKQTPELVDALIEPAAPECHAANLAIFGGSLRLAFFAGSSEGRPDVSVWRSDLSLDGAGWSVPRPLEGDETLSEQNPVLFPSPDGRLWLFSTAQQLKDQSTAVVNVRESDDGETFSPPRVLLAPDRRGGAYVRQPPVVLASGRWLLPTYRCGSAAGVGWTGDRDVSTVTVSDDSGRTWIEHPVVGSEGCVQMCVALLADATLLALFRSRWADHLYESRSDGSGLSWSAPKPTELPNNNSSIQYIRLADDRLALVYNDSRADAGADAVNLAARGGRRARWGTPRSPISLAIGDAGGRAWRHVRDLESSSGACAAGSGANEELSYPTLTQSADGDLHIAYTRFRRAIRYRRIGAAELAEMSGASRVPMDSMG